MFLENIRIKKHGFQNKNLRLYFIRITMYISSKHCVRGDKIKISGNAGNIFGGLRIFEYVYSYTI